MEQHPVPQNVTTFQFRLIGDMTIKQFGYLCAGAILAFIAYKLPFPFIITWPLTFLFAFLGIGFAFIPIEERPMDVWVFSFFRRVYSPTQYVWTRMPQAPQNPKPPVQKDVPKPPTIQQSSTISMAPPQSLQTDPKPAQTSSPAHTTAVTGDEPASHTAALSPLSGLFQQSASNEQSRPNPTQTLAQPPRHSSFLDKIIAWFTFAPKTQVAPQVVAESSAPPLTPVTGRKPDTDTETESVHQKMTHLEQMVARLEEQLHEKSDTEKQMAELQKQLADVLAEKAKAEKELIAIKTTTDQPDKIQKQAIDTDEKPPVPKGGGSTVNVITTQEAAVKVGLPKLTNTPNVVTGLVKDDEGNLLPGILVTITNKEGVPVRALKTNKLGQFFASTPLSSGVYFVEIEDPRSRFTFTRVQITLNGTVVPVLEVIAKSEKQLTREKLTQQIFGDKST